MEDCRRRVTIESKLTTISSKPVNPGTSHVLSPLDHAMRLHYLHLIFYYHETPFGVLFDLDPVRISLSDLLSMYPPVTGRLTRRAGDGKWEVKCNDAGVRTIRAKVGTTVDEWLKSPDSARERDLMVWEDMPEDPSIWSPFRIQINEFEEGGLALGLSCTHMLADLTSASVLFKSWTDIHRRKAIEHLPVFQKTSLASTDGVAELSHYYESKSQASEARSVKMVTATFKFSNSNLKDCISESRKSWPGLNPFDFLCALFWTRIAQLKDPDQGSSRDHYSLSVCVDYRKFLYSPLPLGQFGNCLHFFPISVPEEEFSRGSDHVAGLVHHRLENLGEGALSSTLEWFESREKCAPPFRMYGPELTCVNMEHLPIYDAMFQDGARPVHVSCDVGNVDGEGLIMVLPSSEEGSFSRTVTVVLPEEEMARLCEDQDILKLEPGIILREDH